MSEPHGWGSCLPLLYAPHGSCLPLLYAPHGWGSCVHKMSIYHLYVIRSPMGPGSCGVKTYVRHGEGVRHQVQGALEALCVLPAQAHMCHGVCDELVGAEVPSRRRHQCRHKDPAHTTAYHCDTRTKAW